MGKKIITILRSKILLNWTCGRVNIYLVNDPCVVPLSHNPLSVVSLIVVDLLVKLLYFPPEKGRPFQLEVQTGAYFLLCPLYNIVSCNIQ